MKYDCAYNWDLDSLQPATPSSNVLTTGTGAPDPGRIYLKQSFAHHGCGAVAQGGIHWVTETPDSIPALRSTSSHVLVWNRGNADPGSPWRRILYVMYG